MHPALKLFTELHTAGRCRSTAGSHVPAITVQPPTPPPPPK